MLASSVQAVVVCNATAPEGLHFSAFIYPLHLKTQAQIFPPKVDRALIIAVVQHSLLVGNESIKCRGGRDEGEGMCEYGL